MAKRYMYQGKEITKRQADWLVIKLFGEIGLATVLLYLITCGLASL